MFAGMGIFRFAVIIFLAVGQVWAGPVTGKDQGLKFTEAEQRLANLRSVLKAPGAAQQTDSVQSSPGRMHESVLSDSERAQLRRELAEQRRELWINRP